MKNSGQLLLIVILIGVIFVFFKHSSTTPSEAILCTPDSNVDVVLYGTNW